MKAIIGTLAVLCLVIACSQTEKEEAAVEEDTAVVQQDSTVVDSTKLDSKTNEEEK
jgi:uncharacterized protein YxeA